MTLFELDRRVNSFFDNAEVNEETGEIIYDVAAFEALQLSQAEKRKNIALRIKNIKSDIAELSAQEKSFAERRKSKEKELSWMERYLLDSLNGEAFECPEVSVKTKTNPEKAVWAKGMDSDIIKWLKRHKLSRFVRTKTEETIDKTELKAYIKSGKDVPMVSVIREQSLVIK